MGHARELAKLGDPDAADNIAEDAARDEKGLGGQDVEATRRMVVEACGRCGRCRGGWTWRSGTA